MTNLYNGFTYTDEQAASIRKHFRNEAGLDEITAAVFESATGRAPDQDDLQRVNCKEAGKVGHWMCGWCVECNRPRFECGHFVERETEADRLEALDRANWLGSDYIESVEVG